MNGRKRVPIQLKGSDEQYFRTREIQARPEPVVARAPEPAAPPRAVTAPETRPKTVGQGKRSEPAPSGEGEVVSRIVPLGPVLSERVRAVAGQTGMPVDDLLYAARKKAVARFRAAIAGPGKPKIPGPERGGETIRISFKLTAAELGRLRGWFDPLDLGVATRAVAPLLAEALRAEVAAICDGLS